jgi:hypothetical protein
MQKRPLKFNTPLISLVWVLGIQFLALPFYHFHPDTQHAHPGESSHRHNAYFHSIELESIVHLTHSNDHNPADHHSQHSRNSEEADRGVELNNETLKSKNPFKVLKIFSAFTFSDIPKEFKTYYLQNKLQQFQGLVFKNQLRERSPPFLFT